jgi:CubicO group peptidase (beta-lactamase class C family)
MIDFFPENTNKITDARKIQITIREMLQMRAGYPWEETDTTYWNAIWSGEYITKIEEIPLTNNPGTEFQYSNLTSNWLGIILARACNTDLKSFGKENLFDPLNVKLGDWTRDIDGYYIGSGDIQFTARDMAKFGLLYLNEGEYNGQKLIPAEWVRESLQRYSENVNTAGIVSGRVGRYFKDIGYGYQWWSASAGNHRFNFAWGHGGQLIILLKDLDMVIVTTADPFYGKKKHFDSWKYEKSIINLVGKFIKYLPVKSRKAGKSKQ